MKKICFFAVLIFALTGCKKEEEGAKLRIKFKFDTTQERLNSFGNPEGIPSGHAAQHPDFNGMSVHFIELVPTEYTLYKAGAEVYQGAEVNTSTSNPYGFTTAIDFDKAIVEDEGVVWYEIPLKDLPTGTFNHLRVSVAYQSYDVKYNIINIPLLGDLNNRTGTISSFLGYFSHINDVSPKNSTLTVNDDKLQGFWAFESGLAAPYDIFSGEAPQGATTVVNPFPAVDNIPQGSCVVSGSLDAPLVLQGDENTDINLTLSFSANNSFEWIDGNGNGAWDIDASGANIEAVVDMGVRGLKGVVE